MNNSTAQPAIGQHIQKQLLWRYATKNFDKSKVISQADWEVLADSLRLAPSSLGLQPWHFVVAQSALMKTKLIEGAPYNREKFETASHIVVFTHLKTVKLEYIDSYIKHAADVRDLPLTALDGFRNMIIDTTKDMSAEDQSNWTARQTYIALGNLLTTASLLGIDACPMEGIEPAKFDEILGLSGTDYTTLVVAALGYRAPDDQLQFAKKVRFPAEQVFTFA